MKILTQSAARCYRRCPREYSIAYVGGYRTTTEPEPLRFGTLIHAGLETVWWDGALAMPPADDFDPYEYAKAEQLLRGYVARWGYPENVQGVEVEFIAPLRNPETGRPSRTWQVGGKLDAIRVPAVVEHKTKSGDIQQGSDYWRQLRLDQQVSTYFEGARALGLDCSECLYDVIGKPALRPYKAGKRRKEDETPEEYGERIRLAIVEDPDRYYQRGTVVRLEDERAEAAYDLWQTARNIRDSELAGRWPRNPDSCFRWGRACRFWDVCTGCASLDDPFLFRKTETTNEELSTTTEAA